MATNYRTPGVYVEEISTFPPSVVAVETAIPAFIGYTERAQYLGDNLVNRPLRITSLLEFEQIFGAAPPLGGFSVTVDADGRVLDGVGDPRTLPATAVNARFRMNYAMRHFYDNGGGDCYVVSIGGYGDIGAMQMVTDHSSGLAALALEDEPTLIAFPDLSAMAPADPGNATQVAATRASYHTVLARALAQCALLGDRFLIADVWRGDQPGQAEIDAFRDGVGTANLKYAAVYHPYLRTTIASRWNEATITVRQLAARQPDGSLVRPSPHDGLTLSQLKEGNANSEPGMYARIRAALDMHTAVLPPAAAVAGMYASVDRRRGVWKSPANESLASVRAVTVEIDNDLNDHMNVHPSGKSINAIRRFIGKGIMVWGARTLDGNSNEWRYASVRRFFNMVEESTKKASYPFVFEPNDSGTWAKVQAMIENFLTNLWREGALAGAKPEDAFYVRVGLGTTMTAQDVLEGRMNVEIGMAVVRPAEFIVLRFTHVAPQA